MALPSATVTGHITDSEGNAVENAIAVFRLTRPDTDGGVIVPEKEEARTDANGDFSVDLWPNTEGTTDSQYHVTVRHPETGEYLIDSYMVVPSGGGELSSLLELDHEPEPVASWQSTAKAYNHAQTSRRYASEDEDTTVVEVESGADTGTYSALHHAAKSGKSATTAERFANEAEDTTVVDANSGADTGLYSSKHHRAKSEQAQAASESARDTSIAARNSSQDARDDSDEHATTSERWATETGTTVVDADSGADSGEYGAKEYAQGDLEGHGGSSKAWATDASSPDGSGEKSAKTLAGEASTSASNAATSESNAATSETNAANSASAAATSESDAQSHLDSFEDRWWGAFSSEPSTDPNGNGPDEGDLYFNITDGELKVYDAALGAWKAAALDPSKFVRVNGANAMEADLDFGGNKATKLADGTASDDGVTKGQLDAVQQNRSYKDPVRAATDGQNIDLTSATDPNPVDGVTLADGDRVLLKDQTDGTENGIYTTVTAADPTTWVRSADADDDSEVTAGMAVTSTEGNNNAEIMWLLTTDDPTLGTDALSFTGFNLAALVGGDGIDKTNNTISVDGTVLRAASKTGADAGVVSGTAGTGGNLAEWNADGDAVDSGVASSEVLQDSDLAANGGTVPETDQEEILSATWTLKAPATGDAGNTQLDFTNDYYLNVDDATSDGGAAGTRWWLNTPEGGEVHIGTRAGSAYAHLFEVQADRIHFTADAGAEIGNPSGGYKGEGTLNAKGVYDDGTLLTDYVFDGEIDGTIDTTKWDAAVPNRERVIQEEEPEHEEEEPVTQTVTVFEEEWHEQKGAYVRRPVQKEVSVYDEYSVLDEDGNEVGKRRVQRTRKKTVPAKERKVEIEERTHEPAREFALDELDPETFAGKWQADRKLPALRRLQARSEAAGKSKSGLGETIQSLVETCEAQAVHIEKLRQRIDALENGQ